MVKDSKVNLVSKINSSQGIKLVIKVYGGSSLNWEFNFPQASDDGNDKKKKKTVSMHYVSSSLTFYFPCFTFHILHYL